MSKARRSAATLVATLLLGGCSSLGALFGGADTVAVSEVGRAMNCPAEAPDMSAQLFAGADAVLVWQQASGVELIGNQAMLPGTYVLVTLGKRQSTGYGFVIGPEARIDDHAVRLHATFFTPGTDDGGVAQVETSPCVLVRVPLANVREVTIYDQDGKRRLRSGLS
jgi:hypothetical protein